MAAILKEAAEHTLTGDKLDQIIREKAFAESSLSIPAALRKKWPLLKNDLTTPIQHPPSMPLTSLQKRWLKTLLQDARIALFAPDMNGLEDTEPLFNLDDIVYFDQYLDGDPYGDAVYREVFRFVLQAVKERRSIRLRYQGRTAPCCVVCMPYRLEYSEKDDKFRILAVGKGKRYIINMARIQHCDLLEQTDMGGFHEPQPRCRTLTFILQDERNTLERALLHFSHFEKETVRLSEYEYRVTLRYEKDDETELLIRVLSFGPMIQVISPDHFIELLRERLKKQSSCEL